jgi:hypothetical protein
MFDFMDPLRTGRRPSGLGWAAWFHKAGNTLTQHAGLDSRRSPALRVLNGKPLALFNPLGENQPSSSRRFKFFAIPAVASGFSDFAFGDCQTLG